MKIEHLIYLREIARFQSISAASKQLYIGQTTLSAIVKSTEEELGVKLFRRTSSGVVPTDEGRQILADAAEIIEKYNNMLHLSRGGQLNRRISFLGDASVLIQFSIPLLQMMNAADPAASILFHKIERRKIVSMISSGIANLGAVYLDYDLEYEMMVTEAKKKNIEYRKIGSDKFYLYANANRTDLAEKEEIDVNELVGERFIGLRHYSSVSNGTAFSESFQKLTLVSSVLNDHLAKEAALTCNAVTILRGELIRNDPAILEGRAIAMPLTGFACKNEVGLYLIHNPRSSLTYHEKLICDCMVETARFCESN